MGRTTGDVKSSKKDSTEHEDGKVSKRNDWKRMCQVGENKSSVENNDASFGFGLSIAKPRKHVNERSI